MRDPDFYRPDPRALEAARLAEEMTDADFYGGWRLTRTGVALVAFVFGLTAGAGAVLLLVWASAAP